MAKQVLVAEGDSWFNLPEFGPLKRTDVIDELEKLNYDVKHVANPGDTIETMAGKDQFYDFAKKLLQLNDPPHAILLSGGGNDIPDNLKGMLNGNNSNPLNKKEVKKVIDGLYRAYWTLLKKINHLCAALFDQKNKIPVLIHGYAYPVPDGREFFYLQDVDLVLFDVTGLVRHGPWLQPKFEKRGYTCLKKNTKTMQKLINCFNCMLQRLDPNKNSFSHIYVQHVDVRKCLKNDLQNNSYRDHWADEFHPSKEGFKLIAKKFDKVIRGLKSIQVYDNQNV